MVGWACARRPLRAAGQSNFEQEGGLFYATGRELIELLRRTSAERGLTVVLATHDTEIAASVPRTVRMEDGRIVDASRSLGIVSSG